MQNRGFSIPNVGRLTAGTIDFDNFKSVPLLQLPEVGKAHVEAAEVELRNVVRNPVEGLPHLIGDVLIPVAEYGAAAVAAGKCEAKILTFGDNVIELFFVALQVDMLYQACAPVIFDQVPQGFLAVSGNIRIILQGQREDKTAHFSGHAYVKYTGLAFMRHQFLDHHPTTHRKAFQIG